MYKNFGGDSVTEYFKMQNLPEILTQEQFLEYLKNARKGDLTAREIIILHNIRLVISRLGDKFGNTGYDMEELFSSGLVGLIKAVDTYDVTKNSSFSNYARRVIDNEITQYMRNNRRHLKEISIETPIAVSSNGEELTIADKLSDDTDIEEEYLTKDINTIIRQLVKQLPEQDQIITMMYFGFYNGKRYSTIEIAELLKISSKKVLNRLSKIKKKMATILEKQKIVETIKRRQSKRKSRTPKTIYELFSNYSREQIDLMIERLSDYDRELLRLRYGDDLDNPKVSEKWNEELSTRFYKDLFRCMQSILKQIEREQTLKK